MAGTSYTTLERIAVGGMGEVFLARQEGLGGFRRTVVLKRLLPDVEGDDDSVHRFLDEARVAGALHHDNVVAILEVGDDGSPFLALEYVHGENAGRLRSMAKKKSIAMPVPVVARIVVDAARGLAHAHDAKDVDGKALNIVHRDVAPKNIFVRTDGTSKIGDFGIAKADRRMSRTATGQVPGTLSYMAPEQARGAFVDKSADQFALGIVLWELLAGKALFKADSPEETLRNILMRKIPPPSLLRPDAAALDKVTRRMLERDPTRRFDTLVDAATAIERALPSCAGDSGKQAVAAFVDAIAGDDLRERMSRIEAGPDQTVRVSRPIDGRKNGTPSPADFAPLGTHDTTPDSPHSDSDTPATATVPNRISKDGAAVVSGASTGVTMNHRPLPQPATRTMSRRRRMLPAAAAALAIVVVGAGATAAWAFRAPSVRDRNLAYLEEARRSNPLLHREWLVAQAESKGIEASKIEPVADAVTALLSERLAMNYEYARANRADAQELAQKERALTDQTRNVLAKLGNAELASDELDMWDYDSCAPMNWVPPDAPTMIQKQLAEGLYDNLKQDAALRKSATDRLLARGRVDAAAVHAWLDPMVATREKLVADSVTAKESELLPLYRQIARIERDADKRLVATFGEALGKAIEHAAFEEIEDPDAWQLVHDTPPSLRKTGPQGH